MAKDKRDKSKRGKAQRDKDRGGTGTPTGPIAKGATNKVGGPDRLEDDAALWARVAETAAPLTAKNRFVDLETALQPSEGSKGLSKTKPRAFDGTASSPAAPEPPSKLGRDKITVDKAPAPATGLDRQTARKLDKGRLAIDARIDLHGMRQREAHGALRKFLHWARGKDYRHVLVITGKGSLRDEDRSFYEEEVRGVLRQAVPHWLSHGDLAPLIVSVAPAPRRLGGDGALYVRLRRRS